MTRLVLADITGLVVAGGRGTRMGGVDKGLVDHLGAPLALHALRRLAPQVGAVAINANRHVASYAEFGAPVWPDSVAGRPGPLAGWLAGLQHCATPWLATVPCDSPNFPVDLVARLAAAARHPDNDGTGGGDGDGDIDVVVAATADGVQPVFALLRATLAPRLAADLAAGERRVGRWTAQQRCRVVTFDDAAAFVNVNTPAELQRLQNAGDAPR